MNKTVLTGLAALVSVAMGGGIALAQQTDTGGSQGLVAVDVSNVRADIAKNIDVSENQVPVTVQLPVGIAANVCGVDANILAKQKQGGNASCAATSTSQALNQAVQKQLKKAG